MMNQRADSSGVNGFLLGLVAGGAVGTALALALAPKLAAEWRERATAVAGDLGAAASARYQDARGRVTEAVGDVAARGQAFRDDLADAVGRTAREVEQFAMASKTTPERRS
jgi:gas vesicle protein